MYEIKSDILDFINDIEEQSELNGGVITPDIAEGLSALHIERDDKIEGVALYTKMLNGESDLIKKEIDRLSAIKKANDNKVKGYKEWLKLSLGCKKFKTTKTSISFRKNKSVNITDIEKLDSKYYKVKTEKVPDKKFIKWSIEQEDNSGDKFTCGGAELIETTSITVK